MGNDLHSFFHCTVIFPPVSLFLQHKSEETIEWQRHPQLAAAPPEMIARKGISATGRVPSLSLLFQTNSNLFVTFFSIFWIELVRRDQKIPSTILARSPRSRGNGYSPTCTCYYSFHRDQTYTFNYHNKIVDTLGEREKEVCGRYSSWSVTLLTFFLILPFFWGVFPLLRQVEMSFYEVVGPLCSAWSFPGAYKSPRKDPEGFPWEMVTPLSADCICLTIPQIEYYFPPHWWQKTETT